MKEREVKGKEMEKEGGKEGGRPIGEEEGDSKRVKEREKEGEEGETDKRKKLVLFCCKVWSWFVRKGLRMTSHDGLCTEPRARRANM